MVEARCFEIGGRRIGDGFPCYVIAEIGQNHQGDPQKAKEMIKIAKDCGADCVKFQKSDLPAKFTASVLSRPYNSPHSFGETYGEHKRFLEFSPETYKELKAYAESLPIHFSASAMDEVSLDFLVSLGVPFIKIGSGDANNFQILTKAAQTNLPIIYSTGMQDMETVSRAMQVMLSHNPNICVLQCTSSYPTPYNQVNLKVIANYRDRFPACPVGYSGHEQGLAVTLASVALGANVVERHFTLDKSQKGSDHACSLDPTELRSLIEGIRQIEAAQGTEHKQRQPSEDPCYQKLSKSVVTSTNLLQGMILTVDHLCVKVSSPIGWQPQDLHLLVGRSLAKDLAADSPIDNDCLV